MYAYSRCCWQIIASLFDDGLSEVVLHDALRHQRPHPVDGLGRLDSAGRDTAWQRTV